MKKDVSPKYHGVSSRDAGVVCESDNTAIVKVSISPKLIEAVDSLWSATVG